jgi:hypothetical protein
LLLRNERQNLCWGTVTLVSIEMRYVQSKRLRSDL